MEKRKLRSCLLASTNVSHLLAQMSHLTPKMSHMTNGRFSSYPPYSLAVVGRGEAIASWPQKKSEAGGV